MDYRDWRLTSEEEEKCRLRGISLGKAQGAKKQAYLDAGGVIPNPDALEDLYEALRDWVEYQDAWGHFVPPGIRQVLAEARVR